MNYVNIRKRAYHHGNLRAALVEAALHAIAEHGPDGFTLRDVARRAGVSPAAPYRHFQDKDGLFAAVVAECADRLGQMVTAAAAEAPADDPLAQLRQVCIAFVEFAVAHPEHFRALGLPGVAARMPPEQQQRVDAWNDAQRRVIAAAQEAGTLARIPLDDLILTAGALVHGLGHLIAQGQLGEVSPARARALAITVTGVLGLGLQPRSEADLPPASRGSPPPPSSRGSPPRPPPRSPDALPPPPSPSSGQHRHLRKAPRKGMRSVKPGR